MQETTSLLSDDRLKRQRTLEREIRHGNFTQQEEIALRMQSLGFAVTQSSISRDLRELGVAKLSGVYVMPSLNPVGRREIRKSSLQALVHSCEVVGPSMVVVKTQLGAASIIAGAVDELSLEGVAGTVAGDDTFFIATHGRSAQKRVLRALERI